MIQRLDYNEEEGDVRGKLDLALNVTSWSTPRHCNDFEPQKRTVSIDGEEFTPPPWWKGDEDASQTFLTSMGVSLDGS